MPLNTGWITGHRYLCVSGHRTDHRTDCWIHWTKLTVNYIDSTIGRSEWFHYCVIVCTIEGIPVDCNHYFLLLNKFVKLNFLSFPVAT